MLKYIKDTEYEKLLDVDSIPDNFDRLAIEASNYINQKTFGRIDENDVPEKVKYVTCLIIDLLNEQETKLSEISNLKRSRLYTFRVRIYSVISSSIGLSFSVIYFSFLPLMLL